MKVPTFPRNRLEDLKDFRLMRKVLIFFSFTFLLSISMLAYADGLASQTDHSTATTCAGSCTSTLSNPSPWSSSNYFYQNIGNGWSTTMTGVLLWIKGNTSFPDWEMRILCYDDSGYTTANGSCTSPRYKHDNIGGGGAAQLFTMTGFVMTDSKYYRIAFGPYNNSGPSDAPNTAGTTSNLYAGGAAGANGWGAYLNGIADFYFQLDGSGYSPTSPRLVLQNLTGTAPPNTPISFSGSWVNAFAYPSSVKYAYFLPYGRLADQDCSYVSWYGFSSVLDCNLYATTNDLSAGLGGPNTSGYAITDGTSIGSPLTADGNINFSYRYTRTGSFTGSLILSSDCNIAQINASTGGDCITMKVDVAVNIQNFQALEPTDQSLQGINWELGTGGGTSGAYLKTDYLAYGVGQPVHMQWHYHFTSSISQVQIYDDNLGGDPVGTITASGSLTNDSNHYATIYYGAAGVYKPHIRVCFTNCTSDYRDIYIGGLASGDANSEITVSDRITSSGSYALFDVTSGVFGFAPQAFQISFGNSNNIFLNFAAATINLVLQGALFLASLAYYILQSAPFFSWVTGTIAPDAGTSYTTPSTLFGITLPDQLASQSGTIEYGTIGMSTAFSGVVYLLITLTLIVSFVRRFF